MSDSSDMLFFSNRTRQWSAFHLRRINDSWIYIDGENFQGARYDIGGDPNNGDVDIAWKYVYTAKDTWRGPDRNLGSIGSLYCLTMDPFEKYDMSFNGAIASRLPKSSPGQYAGMHGFCVSSTRSSSTSTSPS